jgi:hypothetical protein
MPELLARPSRRLLLKNRGRLSLDPMNGFWVSGRLTGSYPSSTAGVILGRRLVASNGSVNRRALLIPPSFRKADLDWNNFRLTRHPLAIDSSRQTPLLFIQRRLQACIMRSMY